MQSFSGEFRWENATFLGRTHCFWENAILLRRNANILRENKVCWENVILSQENAMFLEATQYFCQRKRQCFVRKQFLDGMQSFWDMQNFCSIMVSILVSDLFYFYFFFVRECKVTWGNAIHYCEKMQSFSWEQYFLWENKVSRGNEVLLVPNFCQKQYYHTKTRHYLGECNTFGRTQ